MTCERDGNEKRAIRKRTLKTLKKDRRKEHKSKKGTVKEEMFNCKNNMREKRTNQVKNTMDAPRKDTKKRKILKEDFVEADKDKRITCNENKVRK